MKNEKYKKIEGLRFGKLVVIKQIGTSIHNKTILKCLCDCGKIKKTLRGSLISGRTKSCGCIRITHGLTKTKEYSLWRSINQRCYNPKCNIFKYYGMRGITNYWKDDSSSFLEYIITDLGKRPTKNHSIDRINNSLGYFPGNLKWSTKKQQANNRRPPCQYKRDPLIIKRDKEIVTLFKLENLTKVQLAIRFNLHKKSINRILQKGVSI
jgi:hypothetical protein